MKQGVLAAVIAVALAVIGASAGADEKDDLIALDKAWGEAGVKGDTAAGAKFVTDDVVSVTPEGVGDKKSLLGGPAAPAGTKYEPTDFKVKFLDDNTAIMTHATKGENAHYSLHVWSKKSGAWRVVATSTTPAGGM